MADSNLNPAPRNVSAIDGKQGVDISGVGQYDENTSLDDIAGAYTNTGKQLGQIVSQAAEHVGDIQTKLIGNDFGGTNPYMYNTYYEPGANDIQSDWRVSGTQKALEEGMERGKKAAEEAAKAAQQNYNDAVNNFNQAVANPTIATVDTSLLGEGNTISELDKTGNFAGTKEHAQNANIDNAINKFNVKWDDKSDTWSNAAQATMQNAGVSQETYDSWTPEQRQAFWDDDANSVYFRNHYAEEDIRNSLGEKGLENYRAVFQNTVDEINKVYDYLNGVTDKLELDPIKIFEYTAADISQTSRWSDLAEFWKGNYHDVNLWTIRYNDLTKEGGWVDQNIKEEYREDVKKFIQDTSREVDYTLNDLDWRIPVGNHPIYDDEALAKLQDFAQGKLTDTAESIYGNKIEAKQEVKEISAEEGLNQIIGIDMDTLRWYKSMKDEHPEVLDVIKNQIAQAYGETNAIEIADGEHYYLINGKYEKPEAGTVVLFAMPGVMDNEGNFNNKDYETFVDCFKKLNNAAANYTEEERKALQDTMQNAWTKYYQSIYLMKVGEAYTGSVADEDMYRSVMYRVDPSKYSDLVVNGKPVKDIVKEWKDLADKDGHKAYVQLGQLLNKAYSNLGFYYGMDQNGNLTEYKLDLADTGEKTVGQVMGNDEDPYKGLTAAQAMALYNVVTTSLQEYQRGNDQDKNINPYFLDDDNADGPQEFANSAWNMFGWMVDVPVLLLNMGAQGILNIGSNEPIDPANQQYVTGTGALAGLWPGNWGRTDLDENFATQSWNEYWTGSPKKGTLNYFVQVSDLQQQNLADAINPYMVEYWFGEEGSTADIKRIGEGYTSRTKPVLELGPLRNFDVYGLNTALANGTAFKESSAKLLGAIAGGIAAGKLGSAYSSALMKGVSKVSESANMLATNIRVEIAAHGIERAIKNTTTEQIAQGTARNTMMQTFAQQAAKSDWGGVAALPASTTAGAISNGSAEVMVNSSKNFVMRGLSDAALDTSGPVIEGFSTEFLERSFSTAETSAALKSYGFTAEQAKAITYSVEENAKMAAKAIAQETIASTTLSLGTGLPAEAFSAMNSATQNMFMKAYNAVLRGSTVATEFGKGSISALDFLQSIGTEGIKEAAIKVAEESAAAAARGMKWTNSDTFRVLSGLGWEGGATRALYAELANDAVLDMFRDNMRNNTNAYLTNEGWERQSVEDYFMNPWTYIQNGIFTGIQFGRQRIGAQIKDAWYGKQYDKYRQAYAASGDNPDAKAASMQKVNEYINKIQKNNNLLMRRGLSYSKLKNSSEKINDDLNYIIAKQYEDSGINPITGEMDKKFTTADDFNDYLKTKKLSTKDRINLANRGLVIETQNNFFISRYELGGNDRTKLGNINDWETNWDLQDIEQRTLDKYYDEVINMKASPLEKQQRMYSLYTQEIMAKYGKVIPGLEAALNNYYGHYLSDMEAALKANPKAQWTLGYTSLAGMTTLSDDSGDVMFGASFGNNFNTVDRNAADVDKSRAYRDIKRQLLDAIKNGDTELTITRADGREKVYHLNKDGLNYLKTLTAYNNANTVHKYYDPIFGDSVQTHEHKDQVPFAEAAYRSTDAIISSTKVATQAAEADAKTAEEIIKQYTELAYSRHKGSAEDSVMVARSKEIVDANTALNVADSEKIYKLSQDRAAAERYVQELDGQKHGELQRRYKEVVPMLAEIDGEIGKVEAQREFRQAVSNTKTAISMYLEGRLSEDNPVFTYKYGENESVKITLDDETLGAIAEAARNGQEFNSDLTIAMMVAKRNAVPRRATSVDAEVANKDYTNVIKDLEADTARTGDDHTASIIKLRQEMKANNVRHQQSRGDASKKSGTKSAVDYGYKAIKGTDLDTATTGFKIDGKDQLVKNAADDYYYLPQAGKKANPRRAQIIEAATAPLRDFLSEQNGGIDKYDERMIAYVTNAAEQNLRNIDTGEENLRVTVGTLKREIMKVAPDAEIWLAAKNSGAIERISTLSSRGAQPAAMMAELKTIMASHSDMPESMRNKFIDTIELYSLMSENANAIKANAFSLDEIVGEGDNMTTKGDLVQDTQSLVSATKNLGKYEKAELKRMVASAGDVLKRASNPNSKYSSALIKKLSSDLSSSSSITKAVKKDFRTTAFDYYKQAVANPTPENQGFVDAAFTWAKARYEADPRAPRVDGQLDLTKVKVNDIDCMNALGVANHEVMLSPFGDKDNHTYAQYMAAQNNVRDFDLGSTNGVYSEQARDYIMLGNATYGQGIEQAERGIDQLIGYFPEAKGSLLKKKENYSLEGRRVSAQYATTRQLQNRAQNIDSTTLEGYGLGKLKLNDLSRAASLAGRLKKAKAEQELLANRPVAETWLGISSGRRTADLSVVPWKTRYDANGNEDTGATIASFKNATRMMNEPTSIAGEIEPGVTTKDYDAIVAKARKDLTALYKEAGLANGRRGRIPAAEIDEFSQKILDSYKNITDNNGSGLANDLLTLTSVRNDNAENALISVMSQAYSESSRNTYDAQTQILNNRVKSLQKRISKFSKDTSTAKETTKQLLNAQLDETNSAIRRHQLLDTDGSARDGKTQFYTDKQILSGEFGRQDINIKTTYRNSNYPSGLEIGEGKILYTVDPSQDGADIMKTGKNEVSTRKLKQYLFDKSADVRNRFGEYYEGFELNSKNFEDNGDGTYTITGKYGYGDMDLHEQEALQISRWENMDMSDINAEKRAILELSTSPIYETYDEMIDLNRYRELINKRADLSSELENGDAIVTINALRKSAYDQYLQLTNALGKEFLDSAQASKKYQAAMAKEKKAFKIDDMDEQMIKSNLSREEYDKYIEAKETLYNVAKFQMSSDSGIYHAKNGVIFAKDGYNPTGFVDTNIAKAILEGRAIDDSNLSEEDLKAALNTKENRKTRKEMQKEINKNQNKGSIHYKNTEAYKAINNSAMDKMSARYTLNNYIEFENQTRDMLTGMGLADEYKILMDKDYSDMMQRVAGKDGGIENDGVKAKFFDMMMHTANLNKTIQDWQLAGGFSNYNAATIAQIRGAILNDPRMALEYLNVFTAAKNSNYTMSFVAQNRDFLYRFVAKTGAGEYITDLNQAISTTPGEGDSGTINSLTNRILSHIDGSREIDGKNKISRGFGRISDDMNALFSDATFVNTFPLFKVRMLQINYDEALRYLKSFKGYEKISADDIDDAAMWMAYAKTTDFLEPRKTRGSSWDEFKKNVANEQLRKTDASWTGAKRDASLMDNASTAFFALRWKMTFGGRVLNGLTNTPGALIRKMRLRNADISDPEALTMAETQFMRRGSTAGVGVMIALSALAMMWNKSLGYDSVSWDDLNIIGEDGEFQVPNILKKFQTLGQFWLPNSKDENGNPTIDPTKKMFGLDPFSSIFTMSNTVARAFDRLVNPNAYQKTPQRGILGSHSSSDAINGFINSPFFQAFGDEMIGSNLLSPYKAMYEVLVDDTYFGNNIWEKRKLADGSDNPNYDPLRNVIAGFAHILNWDWMLSGGTNKWVKGYGSDKYENSGKIGTVAGSGVFQHEFITAAISIINGEALEGIVEAGELPIKTKTISGSARTDFNVRIKNIVTQYVQEYKDKVGDMNNLDAKDAEYAKLVKKCADVVADWSAKNEYVLGKDQELVAYVTKSLMAICAGEYNDNLDYIQNAYWKAQDIAQIEQSEELFLGDPDLERYIAEGKSVEEFAAEKNRRSEAYNQAIDDEYQARVALKEAGLPDSYLAAYEEAYGNKDKNDFKTQMKAVNKQVFAEVHGVLEGPIGEFKNFKEMKQYYETQIEAASTTKQKAKLANKYNDILTEAIAPYVNKYGAAILSDGYYNNQNLANSIAEYVILPADKYYYGKTPRASYLRDLFHVGYRDNSAMPSDKEVYEKYTQTLAKIHEGASATAAGMLDRLISDYKSGRIYISPYDYSRIVRMKSQLNARSKQ